MTTTIERALVEFQCPWCVTLVKPNQPSVEHPRLGLMHEKCAAALEWRGPLPGVDPVRFLADQGER